MMSVEEKVKKVSTVLSDQWMRLCTAKFLEYVSFDEHYFDTVIMIKKKQKQVNLHLLFKGVHNLKKFNGGN